MSAVSLFLLAAGALAVGCGGSDDNNRHTGKHSIWFMGAVVDGASGAPIKTYTITLVSGTSSVAGKVDAMTGRYTLGPLEAWNDYGVVIDSDGYRKFSSYNAGIAPPSLGNNSNATDIYSSDTTQTFNFDASLFPTALAAPDVAVVVTATPLPAAPLAGSFRMQPTSQPPLVNQPTEVPGQAWANDNDLYAAAVSGKFTSGAFTAMGANLVYGVSYTVSIYDIEGYQPTNQQSQQTVQAGVNTGTTVTLSPQLVTPPVLLSTTADACRPPAALTDTASAMVTITLNAPVVDATTSLGGAAEVLDNAFNANFTMGTSSLAFSVTSTMQERGTSLAISGSTVMLAWNPNVGVATKGPGDTVRSVTYNLNNIFVQRGKATESRVSLGSLFPPNGIITCTAP